ncbi:MAG TPA: cbb3-type cytochrome c oxidase subunit II [Myxococcota bacterium]|nr:cbb3-type cytochrome c oxidase subunit II [Myxococcota bacterium]
MSFHTNHRLLVAFAFFGYAILTYLIAIGPALQVQNTSPLPGAHARSAEEALGRERYLAEGCGFCHTQFVRDLPMDRPYGRASLAEDYALEDPPLLGTQRTGPDLSNVGVRQSSDAWHLLHLFNPRIVVPQSVMPGYPWYFELKDQAAANDVTVAVPPAFLPAPGKVVVAKPEARALVAYLKSLRQLDVSP